MKSCSLLPGAGIALHLMPSTTLVPLSCRVAVVPSARAAASDDGVPRLPSMSERLNARCCAGVSLTHFVEPALFTTLLLTPNSLHNALRFWSGTAVGASYS